jgi:hypothetical protein
MERLPGLLENARRSNERSASAREAEFEQLMANHQRLMAHFGQ